MQSVYMYSTLSCKVKCGLCLTSHLCKWKWFLEKKLNKDVTCHSSKGKTTQSSKVFVKAAFDITPEQYNRKICLWETWEEEVLI